MVRSPFRERLRYPFGELLARLYMQGPQLVSKRYVAGKKHVTRYLVELTGELTCMKIDHVIATLELVKLLKDYDRNDHVIFLEIVYTRVIMQ